MVPKPSPGQWTYPNYMLSFIKILGAVLEKNADKIMTLCNFNKDVLKVLVLSHHITMEMYRFMLANEKFNFPDSFHRKRVKIYLKDK